MVAENVRDGSRARYFDFLYQRSDLYMFLYNFVHRMRVEISGSDDGGHGFYYRPPSFKEWKNPFKDILSLSRNHNVGVLFVIFPTEEQIATGKEATYGPLSTFFEKEGAYYIDLISYFRDTYGSRKHPLFLQRDNLHPSQFGHEVAAGAIADYILSHHLL